MANLSKSCGTLIQERLDAMVKKNGGAVGSAGSEPDPLTTAQVLVLASKRKDVAELLGERAKRSVEYLLDAQHRDGHWERPNDTWHSSITAWAVHALARWQAGDERLVTSIRWLRARELPNGGVSESSSITEANTYSTANTVAAYVNAAKELQQADLHLRWLLGRQSSDGGFVDSCVIQKKPEPSISSYVWHGLEDLGDPTAVKIRSGVEAFVSSTQRPSGAWTTWYDDSDTIEGTAAALRVLIGARNRHASVVERGFAFLARTPWPEDEQWVTSSLAYLSGEHPSFE